MAQETSYTSANAEIKDTMNIVDDVSDALSNLSVDTQKQLAENNDEKEQSQAEGEIKLTKKERKKLTMYWGVELGNDVFDNPQIKSFLDEHPDLIKLEKIHSTLLFVGKKINKDEEVISPFSGKECEILIDAYGYSDDALTLRVKSITADNQTVPTFAIQQHITMALKKGIFAKDSVKTLLGEGTVEIFTEPIILTGKVKRYMF